MSENLEDEQDQEDGISRCLKCNSRTHRIVNFIARLFYYPGLWRFIDSASGVNFERKLPELSEHLCATCQRLKLLPVVDLTNQEVLDWLPEIKVIAPGTEVIYTSSIPSAA